MASSSARHRKNSTVVKRSIELARHKTSVSLENEFWEGLGEIARNRNVPIAVLIEQIHNNRTGSNLSSSIRLFVLNYFKTVSRPSPSNTTQDLSAEL
jgi:predicted DNA-binding ribbon-helix-helix protein